MCARVCCQHCRRRRGRQARDEGRSAMRPRRTPRLASEPICPLLSGQTLRTGRTLMATENAAPEIRAFWQPGCTSCLRMKEFLQRHGVPFTSVNVLEEKGAMEELA